MRDGTTILNSITDDVSESFVPLEAELSERVAWFITVRWVAVAGIVLGMLIGKFLLGFTGIAARPILALAALLLVLNCVYSIIRRRLHQRELAEGSPVAGAVDRFARLQVVLDLLILTAILQFSGGIQNPFKFFYIFHCVIASILLSRRSAYGVAALCVALYTTLIVAGQYEWLPVYHLRPEGAEYTPGYAATSVVAISSTVFIAVFIASSIMSHLVSKEAELELAWREVKQLEAAKSQFLMLVSHEMKSPIVAIESLLDAVYEANRDTLSEKPLSMLLRARDRAESLLALTKDLLTFSQQEHIGPESDIQRLDMKELTQRVLKQHQDQAAKRSVKLEAIYPTEAIGVMIDSDAMELVVSNLVSNAIRYTPAGGNVKVGWQVEPSWAVLEVADTGIGIPEAEMPNVFKEFFRAENAKKFTGSGTGLGLAITRNVVEHAAGTISVTSREGEGTTFTVRLPLSQA